MSHSETRWNVLFFVFNGVMSLVWIPIHIRINVYVDIYCYEFVNIECKICICYLFLYCNISDALEIFIFGENLVILAKFCHETRTLLLHCNLNDWRSLAIFLATI